MQDDIIMGKSNLLTKAQEELQDKQRVYEHNRKTMDAMGTASSHI